MNLKEIRVLKGFSQENAAKMLGIPLRTYKRYENEIKYQNTYKYEAILSQLNSFEKQRKSKTKIDDSEVLIIGAGYVGYNFGKVLSKRCNVSFLDIDLSKVTKLQEEGYSASSELSGVGPFDVAIICLPTNYDEELETFEIKDIKDAVQNILSTNKNCLIIIKSTVSVGFTRNLSKELGKEIYFMPEFLREKTAYEDSLKPSRLIIGANKVSQKLINFSKMVEECIDIPRKTIFMSTDEAEATKLFSNAYLAMRVAFFNELDTFAYKKNMDTKNIIKGIGLDPRIGDYYNNPSFGYGGYCLPKDTKVINAQTESELLNAVISANDKRKEFFVHKLVEQALSKSNKPTIGFIDSERSQNTHKSSTTELIDMVKKYPVFVVVFGENSEDLNTFCNRCDLIVTNKKDPKLDPYKLKVFTRSIC